MGSEEGKSLWKLTKEPQVYKPLIILLFMFLLQQFSGCYILIFYTINIFRNLSLNFSERINENMALMLLGSLRLIMSVIASGYETIKIIIMFFLRCANFLSAPLENIIARRCCTYLERA